MKAVFYLFILAIFWIHPVLAEFYRYTDKHGNVLYTDDLSKVPAALRPTVKPYDETTRKPAVQEKVPPSEDRGVDKKEDQSRGTPETLENERKQLEQREKDLNKEYNLLVKERETIDKEKVQAVTPDQVKTYNQKIVDFNARIEGYEQKRKTYAEEVHSYNERLKEGSPATENK